jgi:hypothetical protein
MIQYVKRKDLNIQKYDACIEKSIQSKIYAFSWYLDLVADFWDVLVLDDYKAVMPVTYNFKYGFKYSLQPYFCQQTAIYTTVNINAFLIRSFLKKIPKSIIYSDVNFSFKSDDFDTFTKQNFILDLNRAYEEIYKNYKKDRRKSLRKATEANLLYQDFNNKEVLINLYKDVFDFLKTPEKYFDKIGTIIDYCLKNDLGFIRNVFIKEKLICTSFFLKHNSRIYYLLGASSKEGKQYGATTFLLDSIIKEYSNTKTVLDFEGSTIPSIAYFYQSFGSELTYYYNYKSNAIKRIFL